MASITDKLLKTRVSKPTLGKWSSGFTAVKKYADSNNIPLIAVWSNGDACQHCINFETAVMNSTFTKWMASSKCVFWFGCSSDKTADDKFEGTGFTWVRNGKLKTYPFVRVYWKSGKVDKCESGDYWIDSSAKGYNAFIKKLNSLLKNYKPDEASKPTEETKPSTNESDNCPGCSTDDCPGCSTDCSDGSCSVDCSKQLAAAAKSVSELTDSVDAAIKTLNDLKTKIQTVANGLK